MLDPETGPAALLDSVITFMAMMRITTCIIPILIIMPRFRFPDHRNVLDKYQHHHSKHVPLVIQSYTYTLAAK